LRPRLLSLVGVSRVKLIGGKQKQFQVLVDPNKLSDYGLSLQQVAAAAPANNANAAATF
jgi:Cu/Ag efflux pump CusA